MSSRFEEKPGHVLGAVKVVAKGNKAIRVREEDGTEEWWPHSQIHENSEIWDESQIGEGAIMIVTKWIAKQKEREVEED